jgi:transcription antitermination factor NusG
MSGGAFGGIKAFRNYVRKAAIRVVPKKVEPLPRWTIVRGDTVVVLSGRSAGKSGKVKRVLRRKNRVIVDGLNLVSGSPAPTAPVRC